MTTTDPDRSRVDILDEKLVRLQRVLDEIVDLKQVAHRLYSLEQEREALLTETSRLCRELDIDQSGNTGWECRIISVLLSIRRKASKPEVVA